MATIVNQNQDPNANTPAQNGTAANGQPLQTVGTAAPQGSSVPGSTSPNTNGATTTTAATSKPQGSGSFTNLSKYLNANQAGGQRIAQTIGNNINNNLQQQNQQAQNYYSQLGNTINSANQTAQQGAGYVKQLNNIGQQIQGNTLTADQLADPAQAQAALTARNAGGQDLSSIQAFAAQPDFSNFQNIQAGRGIDQNLLAQQQAKALSTAQGTVTAAQQAQNNLSSEGGRFQLLQNQFGGGNHPGYSQGDQRLDQVLLGQSGNLGQVQQTIGQQAQAAQAQTKLAQNAGNDVSRLTSEEQGLVGDINTAGTNNETAYQNMLASYIDPTNTDRANQVADLNRAIGTYQDPSAAYAPGFTADQMKTFGLNDQNQGVYNVFAGQNGVKSANDIATIGPDAATYQDVANQGDVDRYSALAKILGNTDQTTLTAPNTIGNAYTANTDDTALSARLATAQTAFNGLNAVGSYSSGNNPSSGFHAVEGNATTQNNVNDLINNGRSVLGSVANSQGGVNPLIAGAQAGEMQNFQDILNQQNYNQTIGGRRNTFLDTEADDAANKANIASGIRGMPTQTNTTDTNAAPITGQDPVKLAALKKLADGQVTGNV